MTSIVDEKHPQGDELPTTPISEARPNDEHSSEGKASLRDVAKDDSDEEAKKEAKGSFKDFLVESISESGHFLY